MSNSNLNQPAPNLLNLLCTYIGRIVEVRLQCNTTYHIHMYLYIYIAYVLTFCKGDSSSLLERKYLLRIAFVGQTSSIYHHHLTYHNRCDDNGLGSIWIIEWRSWKLTLNNTALSQKIFIGRHSPKKTSLLNSTRRHLPQAHNRLLHMYVHILLTQISTLHSVLDLQQSMCSNL